MRLRYTDEDQEYTSSIDSNIGLLFPVDKDDQAFREWAWCVALCNDILSNILGYVSYNRGLKSGGFNSLAQSLGFRLNDIQMMFGDAKKRAPCPRVRLLITERVTEARRKIAKLTSLCERMEKAMTDWQNMPDCVPNGDDVCRLIESRMEP